LSLLPFLEKLPKSKNVFFHRSSQPPPYHYKLVPIMLHWVLLLYRFDIASFNHLKTIRNEKDYDRGGGYPTDESDYHPNYG